MTNEAIGFSDKNGERRLLHSVQCRGTEKVVIAGGIQCQARNSARVHEHVIEVPEIDIGQIRREDVLNVAVETLASLLVSCFAGLLYKLVQLRIRVLAAIGAFGRKFVGGERVLKNIGVFIPANPAQRIELKGALGHVGKEGGELVSTNVERDSHVAQLLL